tara:strand:+ start:1 stop:945 length:945 start_codon:yes stop_codon:yes gene_type:complete
MTIKKKFLISLFLFLNIFTVLSADNIEIVTKINNEIITNFDVEKESKYLKILNPKLRSLDNQKIFELSKKSLIKEIIKISELEKYLNINEDNEETNFFVDQYLKDLSKKLNLNNQDELKQLLVSENNYSFKEIKEKFKIEILWNQLIYARYESLVKIDKEKLLKKIEKLDNINSKEYLLNEIVFKKKDNQDLDELIKTILTSISSVGFNNTATIYSIADSSKFGGKIGWVAENNLSENIFNELNKIDKNEYTKIIKIGNNNLILNIEDIRFKEIKLNKENELKKMIKFETNKQLNQFSRIYFDKTKKNFVIYEK